MCHLSCVVAAFVVAHLIGSVMMGTVRSDLIFTSGTCFTALPPPRSSSAGGGSSRSRIRAEVTREGKPQLGRWLWRTENVNKQYLGP